MAYHAIGWKLRTCVHRGTNCDLLRPVRDGIDNSSWRRVHTRRIFAVSKPTTNVNVLIALETSRHIVELNYFTAHAVQGLR